MVDYTHSELFWKGSMDKQWKIEYDGGTITNNELFDNSIDLSESLCSETNLKFGCCEAGCIKFKVGTAVLPLAGKWLTISVAIDHHSEDPLLIGKYKVLSDKPTADRQHREIVAYDAMYDIISADVAAWYSEILPSENSQVTLRQFRNSFVEGFGLEEEEVELVNDDEPIKRTINPEQLSGKDVITAICELNGCFGHIARDGKFRYVMLPKFIQGVYSQSVQIESSVYISGKYEDYQVETIDKVQIRQEENDIGAIYPDTEIDENDNCYIVQGNFLVYGKSHEELFAIAGRILGVISGVVYRPFEADCMGNPCLEVGDAVTISTKYKLIESYILRRNLKGLQALVDTYTADGSEKQQENVNSVHTSIEQLQGKTNTLKRTVEETRSEIKDLETGVSSQIVQLANEIQLEVSRATGTEVDLAAAISVALGEIALKVSKDGVIQAINLSTEEGVTINASKVNLAGYLQVGMLADMDNPTGWVITKHPGDENANYIYGIRGSGNNLVIKTGGDVAFAAGLPEDYKPGDSTAGSALQLYHDGKILISAINFRKEDGTLSGWMDYGDLMSGVPNFSTIDVARSMSTDEYGSLVVFKGSTSEADDVPTKSWVEEYVKKNGGGKGFTDVVTCDLIQDATKTIAMTHTSLHTYLTTYTKIE